MAITYLKRGKSDAECDQDDSRTRKTVETALKDIETHGDIAVREFSHKFDNYVPDSFRLTQEQIDTLIAELSTRELDDIRFAQNQIRRFAEAQRASMQDIEIETRPRP